MLTEAGWDCELLAAEPQRPNLVARLRGETDGPTLALICHFDIVPAEPASGAASRSGATSRATTSGRGALDMKDQVAAEARRVAQLGRAAGDRPGRAALSSPPTRRPAPTSAPSGSAPSIPTRFAPTWSSTRARASRSISRAVASTRLPSEKRASFASSCGRGDTRATVAAAGRRQRAAEARADPREARAISPRARPLPTPSLPRRLLGEVPADLDGAVERIRAEDPELADLLAEPQLGVTFAPDDGRHAPASRT